MKKATLLLATLLFATSSFAQPYELEKIPVQNNQKLDHFMMGCATTEDKFVFSAQIWKPERRNHLFYHNGYGTIKPVPESIMNGVEVSLVYPLSYKNNIFFSGYKDDTDGLYTWDGYNPIKKISNITTHSMSQLGNCFVDNKIYFYASNRTKTSSLYELNLETYELKKLTDNNYNVSGVIAHEGKVYFFDINKREYINYYDVAKKAITKIETGIKEKLVKRGYGISAAVSAGGYLYLSIYTEELGYELYECDGNSVHLVKNLAPYNNDGVSQELVNYNEKVYFAGNETGDEVYHLYSYDPISKGFTEVSKEGYYPSHFCIANNKLYFTMNKGEKGNQVYEYDDITNKVTALTNRDLHVDDEQFLPWSINTIGNKLYITSNNAFRPPNHLNIHTIDLHQDPTSVNNARITALKVTAHPNPTTSNTTLNIAIPTASKVNLVVTDATGKQIYEHHTMATLQRHSITVPMQELAAGVYLYQLSNESGILLHSGRLVKK